MKLFLGGDIGGTKADFVLIDETGKVIKFVETGGINFQIGRKYFKDTLREILKKYKFSVFNRGVIGVAGVFREEEKRELESHFPGIKFMGDIEVLLHGEFGSEPGIIVIAGTGSIVALKDAEGNIKRFGGYGYLLDDTGSGFLIGKRALLAAIKHFEGYGPKTSLTNSLLEHFGKNDFVEIIPHIYSSESPQRVIASLSCKVFELYKKDEVATEIIHNSVKELAELVSHILTHNPGISRCALSGGLFNQKIYFELFKGYLSLQIRDIEITLLKKSPAVYAAELARDIKQ